MEPITHNPYFKDAGTFTPDKLIGADNVPEVTRTFTLKQDAAPYVRGTVLEESATAGVYQRVTADADAACVLLEYVDATAANAKGTASIAGSYNANALVLGAGATLAGTRKTLESKGIYVSDGVAY